MTLYEFNALPYERQLVTVFDEGTFLARRWEEEDGINLYYLLGGVFVEIYYDTPLNQIVRVRAFTSLSQLEEYAANVQLPSL
ncbi:MAG: hypothetical protein ACRYG7_02875 [Janthinobacterium lividum]